jgi:hypothetical protein
MPNVAWLRTLVLSGVAAGAAKWVEHAGGGPAGEAVAAAAVIIADKVSEFLVHLAHSQREEHLSQAERRELASRNHHLRRGMAAALRRGLEQVREANPDLPAVPYHALFKSWDELLQLAESGDAGALERFFPEAMAEEQWEGTNPYSPKAEEDAHALAGLLREWLTVDLKIYQRWSEEEAIEFARTVLPCYRQAFADDLAGDSHGLLFQAFTVKGINQIRALVEQSIAESRAEHEKTRALIRDIVEPRPISLGKVRTWALPAVTPFFTGRESFLAGLHGTLQEKRAVLISASGGFGKTQAALEYARRFGGHYEDVLWIRANTASSLFESYRQIAAGLRLLSQKEPSEADVQRALKSWLAEHPRVLVVFDNLDDPQLARDYWPAAKPKPFLLATSRRRDVGGLERMRLLDLDVWEPEEAVKFLAGRTGRADLEGAEREAAATLARETGYLPLALEQAGAYLAKTGAGFAEYLRTYERVRLKLLEREGPQAGGYPLSVATTWQASMERVPRPRARCSTPSATWPPAATPSS